MSVNGIDQALAQMRVMAAQAGSDKIPAAEEAGGFADMLKDSLGKVNELQKTSSAMKTAFEKGESDASLAEIMIASQKASVAFQSVVQVRNKMLEAYKDVMGMSI